MSVVEESHVLGFSPVFSPEGAIVLIKNEASGSSMGGDWGHVVDVAVPFAQCMLGYMYSRGLTVMRIKPAEKMSESDKMTRDS